MTPEITTRSFTNDQAVFDNIFFNNYYKLKANKNNSKIFLDIGAHSGFFSFTALTLGARKVYSIEPFLDNFKAILQNCYKLDFIGRVTPFQLGIYTESIIGKFSTPKFIDNIFFDLSSVGLIKDEEENYYPCQCHSLDTILKDYCYNEEIDVLKINIGYAEREILTSSTLLEKNVKAVCGEVSCVNEEFIEFKKIMGIKGFINCFSLPANEKDRTFFIASRPPISDNFDINI